MGILAKRENECLDILARVRFQPDEQDWAACEHGPEYGPPRYMPSTQAHRNSSIDRELRPGLNRTLRYWRSLPREISQTLNYGSAGVYYYKVYYYYYYSERTKYYR